MRGDLPALRRELPQDGCLDLGRMGARILSGTLLLALWCGAGWVLAHQGRIKAELRQEEALPRPAPRANIMLLWVVVLVGLSGLLLYFTFG